MIQFNQARALFVCALLTAALTFTVFHGALLNEFVDLDDLGYIVENRNIDSFNWQTVKWAFTSFHEANWHPVTMLSLALDRQMWGDSPYGFHLVNILIHCCTVFCCCYVYFPLLKNVTGKSRPAINDHVIVAATFVSALLFAIHPLRVESVVWASERKDVLCLFFIVSTLWFYLRFIKQSANHPEVRFIRIGTYWAVIIMSCMAMLSKPAAVTLPLVLLLLDYYPLGRITNRSSLLRALYEKIPLLILSLVTGIMTVCAQQYAITMAPDVNVISRVLIASKALVYYLWKMLWPVELAPYYPHPGNVHGDNLAGYVMYFAAVCITLILFIVLYKKHIKIWLILSVYYLITLLPMLGVIQVGGQWVADRYTYLPALGISLMWGGGFVWFTTMCWQTGTRIPALLIGSLFLCQVIIYSVMTKNQIMIWRNNESLSTKEIDLFPSKSGAAYYSRAKYRTEHGDCQNALYDIDNAMAIALRNNVRKRYADISLARAEVFICLGRISEAFTAVDWAIQTSSTDERAGYVEYRNMLEERFLKTGSFVD